MELNFNKKMFIIVRYTVHLFLNTIYYRETHSYNLLLLILCLLRYN